MKILISNPSLQYTRNSVKALLNEGHEVYFATAYWYKKDRLFERLLKATPINKFLIRYSDSVIPDSIVFNNTWCIFLHFFVKLLPIGVEQKSYWEDLAQDRWVAKMVNQLKPELTIGYEKSCFKTFKTLELLKLSRWLDLAQVHPSFIKLLRNKFSFFQHITGSKELYNKISLRKVQEYALADQIISLSNFAAQTLIEESIPKQKIQINPLGFDETIFFSKSVNSIEALGAPLKLVYAGIITQRKGVHLLLNLMEQYTKEQVSLTLIGAAGDASHLLEQAILKPNIHYIPYLNQKDLAEELRHADLFVFPSYLDSWAAVVVEAMACGLPVIVSENTGAAQVVTEQTGKIIPVDDLVALKIAIDYFINHPKEKIEMGANAANLALNYNWQLYNSNLNSMLTKLASSKNNV